MTYRKHQNNRDENEPLIVAYLEARGCLVQPLVASDESGVADLLCASPPDSRGHRVLFLVEVKNPAIERNKQRLRKNQVDFHVKWFQTHIFVVKTIEDVDDVIAKVLTNY